MLPLVRVVPSTQSENQSLLMSETVWVLSSPPRMLLLLMWLSLSPLRPGFRWSWSVSMITLCKLQVHTTLSPPSLLIFSTAVMTSFYNTTSVCIWLKFAAPERARSVIACCVSGFPVAKIKHHDQYNLQKTLFFGFPEG